MPTMAITMSAMIRGRVHPQLSPRGEPPITGKPRIDVTVANIVEPTRSMTLDAVVDTGATVHLALPQSVIDELGLQYLGKQRVELANGAEAQFDVYTALVSWRGQGRMAPAFASESEPLVGMAMLWGSRLTVDAWDGGDVIVAEVPDG